MSAATASTTTALLKDRALQSLFFVGLKARHPSLTVNSITKVTCDSLEIRVPVADFVENGRVSETLLENTCHNVCRASWMMSEDPSMAVEDVVQSQVHAHLSSLPDHHQHLLIKTSMKRAFDSLPNLQFYAGTLENDKWTPVLQGGSSLFSPDRRYSKRQAEGIPDFPSRPSKTTTPSVGMPVALTAASAPTPAPPVPNVQGSAPATSAAIPPAPSATANAGPSTSRRPTAAPNASFVYPTFDKFWNPDRLSCYCLEQWIVDFPPTIRQQYMCLSMCPDKPDTYTELNEVLEKIGVKPINVAFTEMYFVEGTQVVYYFDAATDQEKALVERNFFKEEHWTTKFNKGDLRRGDPGFLTSAMPMREIYRTMLVASRLHVDKVPFVDRLQTVANPQELRRAFRNPGVMSIRSTLNETGARILRRLRTEVGI